MSLWDQVVKMEQVVLSVEFNGRRLNVWQENKQDHIRYFFLVKIFTLKFLKDEKNFQKIFLDFL